MVRAHVGPQLDLLSLDNQQIIQGFFCRAKVYAKTISASTTVIDLARFAFFVNFSCFGKITSMV